MFLDAPRGDGEWRAAGTVVDGGWFSGRSPWDTAVLRLDRPAPAAPPALRTSGVHANTRRAVGTVAFANAPAETWVFGMLGGRGGTRPEYVQIDVETRSGIGVVAGFSGSGVSEDGSGELLGIVCESFRPDRNGAGGVCWMIPIEAVPRVWEAGGDRLS